MSRATDEHVVSVSPRELRTVEPPILTYRAVCACGWKSVRFWSMKRGNDAAHEHIRQIAKTLAVKEAL